MLLLMTHTICTRVSDGDEDISKPSGLDMNNMMRANCLIGNHAVNTVYSGDVIWPVLGISPNIGAAG